MNTPTDTTTARPLDCPTSDQWLHLLSDRESGDVLARRPELHNHLDDCAACASAVSEVRRFQTLLLRAKAPVLSLEQRQSLDERIQLQSGLWTRPARFTPWLIWGAGALAAAALAFLVARPFGDRHPEAAVADVGKGARGPSAENAHVGVVVSAMEGDIEVAGRDGHWRRLAPGMAVHGGVRLRAVVGGKVLVPGRFEVVLQANSEVEALALNGSTAYFRVRKGEVACQVDKLKRGERFAVMFGAFRASVVGTQFAVQQDGAGAGGRVVVSEGAVRVDSADEPAAPMAETTTVVRAGNRWQHKGGVMSLEPVPAPVVAEPAAALPLVQVAEPAAAPVVEPMPAAAASASVVEGTAKAATPHHTGKLPVGARQIVIEVPHQTMPRPTEVPAGPDSGARQK